MIQPTDISVNNARNDLYTLSLFLQGNGEYTKEGAQKYHDSLEEMTNIYRGIQGVSVKEQFDIFSLVEFQRMRSLRQAKENDYGMSWRMLGARGLFVRIGDKFNRLKSLLWHQNTQQVKNESIRDTAVDLINYGFFLLYCLDEGNLMGPTAE